MAELLTGPLGGADAVAVRRLRQALRAAEIAGGGGRASDDLLVEAVLTPGALALLDPRVGAPARRVAAVLAAGGAAAATAGATAETVLWALWETSGLAAAWRRTALRGGQAGARADRDLDAVVALFEAAARYVDRLPHAGAAGFLDYLEGQDLPSDTLAERAPDGDAVTLVTAASAAGREWDVVAVTGVQEGVWPDLRLRSSLLGAQALADLLDGRSGAGGGTVAAQRRAVLDDELRLFHVAVSRARRHLLVTAVRSEDELPSGFVDLVDPLPDDVEVRPVTDVPRAMTLPALVAELRGVVTDETAHPARRDEAARRLAELARAGVPGAHPDDWYGLADVSDDRPLRGPDDPVTRLAVQGRAVRPLRAALAPRDRRRHERRVVRAGPRHARPRDRPGRPRRRPGQARAAPRGTDRPARARRRLGRPASRRAGRATWSASSPTTRCWPARPAAGSSPSSRTSRSGSGRAVVRGQVDRLERDAEGRLVVVDLKTGRTAPTKGDVARHAQLGVYQVAVEDGGFEDVAPGAAERRRGAGRSSAPTPQRRRPQPGAARVATTTRSWARRLVLEVADGMAGATFAGDEQPALPDVRRPAGLPAAARGPAGGRMTDQQLGLDLDDLLAFVPAEGTGRGGRARARTSPTTSGGSPPGPGEGPRAEQPARRSTAGRSALSRSPVRSVGPTRRPSRSPSSRRTRSRRSSSSPVPARARPRRWPPGSSGSSRTGTSRPRRSWG